MEVNDWDFHYEVSPDDEQNLRFSDFAIDLFPPTPSKNAVKKAIKRGELWINGAPASTGHRVRTGDVIRFKAETKERKPYPLSIPILYEDKSLAIVWKPAGLPVSGTRHRTLENALIGVLAFGEDAGALSRPFPVHRIDYATEGAVLFAKSHFSLRVLHRYFRENTIEKTYYCVVNGKAKKKGSIDKPLNGKAARTLYCAEHYYLHSRAGLLSLLRINIQTGRTHQIRKHLAGIGHPIIGDKRYNTTDTQGFRGLHLCAYGMTFRHPVSEKELSISGTLPDKISRFKPD